MSSTNPLEINVIVRRILKFLLEDPVDLMSLSKINKTFKSEVISHLKRFEHVEFWTISCYTDSEDYDSDSAESDDEEYDYCLKKLVFNEVISSNKTQLIRNLEMLVLHSPVKSLDFSRVSSKADFNPLFNFKKITKIIFPSLAVFGPDWSCFFDFLMTNLGTLRELRNPEPGFLSFCEFGRFNVLEADFWSMRPFTFSGDCFTEGIEHYVSLLKNIHIDHLILHGHNRTRFSETDKIVLENRMKISFVAVVEPFFNDDLSLFREWKNRNWRFDSTKSLDIHLMDLQSCEISEVLFLLCFIFPMLEEFSVFSMTLMPQGTVVNILRDTQKYCRSNFENVQKHLELRVLIPKGDETAFQQQLRVLEGYGGFMVITEKRWEFKLRINSNRFIFIVLYVFTF